MPNVLTVLQRRSGIVVGRVCCPSVIGVSATMRGECNLPMIAGRPRVRFIVLREGAKVSQGAVSMLAASVASG